MNKEKLKEMFNDLLNDYQRAEHLVIQEYDDFESDAHGELAEEIARRREEFIKALEHKVRQ